MDNFFIFCAEYLFIAVFFIAGIYFFSLPRKTQIRIVLLGMICGLISYGLALIAGLFYYDPRPFVEGHFKPLIQHDTENGFPSDHVLMLSVVAAVFSIYQRNVAAVLWFITGLVAFSRVYVGVHHIIDVLASIMIVISGTFISLLILKKGWLDTLINRIQLILHGLGLNG
jgi:undecaprenyl-diphosphatase